MVKVDVVIVGGGPAGCSAAFSLRTRGCSVAVVSMPSRRKKPTETSAPVLKQMLQSLGAEMALSACEPCFGIVSNWGRSAPVLKPGMASPFGDPWFIHRSRFDACLQQMARDRGVLWITALVQEVKFNSTGVRVRMTDGSVQAHWLIAANGSPSWVANITHQMPATVDSMIAFWAHIPTRLDERLLWIEVAKYGWWYMCPGDATNTYACCVTDALEARATGVAQVSAWNERFQATNLFQQLGCCATAGKINVVSASTAFLPRQQGQSWIAVGDAAAKLDPLGSSGTITALDSGQRAANAVADALNGNVATIQKNASWSAGLVDTFTRQRGQHYALEAQKWDGKFWGRRANANYGR